VFSSQIIPEKVVKIKKKVVLSGLGAEDAADIAAAVKDGSLDAAGEKKEPAAAITDGKEPAASDEAAKVPDAKK
jgi:hypothetical protein